MLAHVYPSDVDQTLLTRSVPTGGIAAAVQGRRPCTAVAAFSRLAVGWVDCRPLEILRELELWRLVVDLFVRAERQVDRVSRVLSR